MKLPLDSVERELSRLWDGDVGHSAAPRIELLTLVALVSDVALVERAERVLADVVRLHPSRTILAKWRDGAEPAITAEVALHRSTPSGLACGDAITLEAIGSGREWLPANIDRLALPDLPVYVWWVGDLPDFDHLLERMLGCADLVIVNSGEMDLRDLEKLSEIVERANDRYALSDLTWVRLRTLQELVARFFDDDRALECLPALARVTIEFAPREKELDVASTQAGLLFGWIANALGLRTETVQWQRGEGWAEATLEHLVAHFEGHPRPDVPPGTILRVTMECEGLHFEIERMTDDPDVFRWSRQVPGVATPPQTLRSPIATESMLLDRALERPKRDRLLERSLRTASRIVRPVAPRLSGRP